ncbi:MAG: hypothetical protein JJU45_02535 [Acidimicrobiia bacterium]|nr:hypothetical protein [Acidimicrobiia bacterium]
MSAPTVGTDAPALVAADPWHRRTAVWTLVGWIAMVVTGLVWGTLAVAPDGRQGLLAAPFVGRWRFDLDERFLLLAPAAAVGAAVVWWGPSLAQHLRWRAVPTLAGAATTLMAFLLAASDGLERVVHPLTTRWEYQPLAAEIDDPLAFTDGFLDSIREYPIHVQGHPPGATLAFWLLEAIGLGGGGPAAALMLVAGGVATASALVAARAVAGEHAARAAAPFLVVPPALLWVGTSTDALFSGVIALGAMLVIVAVCRPASAAGAVIAAAGGVVLATALHLTYGAVPLLAVPFAVAVLRRRLGPLLWASVGAASVTAAWVAAGFWWFDGLDVTQGLYWEGIAAVRPWPYHLLVGNPSVLFVSVGPAAVVGLALAIRSWLQRRPDGSRAGAALWILPVTALAAVLVANASMLSKSEVERIWLPFTPWLLLACAAVGWTPARARWWLVPQVTIAVVLQALLRSPW